MVELNLTKQQSIVQLDLRKKEVATIVGNIPALSTLTSRVALVLDFSGSMSRLYENGTVQSIIERIMPIALQFDDNGELDLWIFESGFKRLGGVTKDNFYGLANDLFMKYSMGGTNYAPVMKDVYKKYIKEEPAKLPNYVIFITDGDNMDRADATSTIQDLSKYPIFWQFVGIGNDSFQFLQKLDDMDGRYVDNANFFSIPNINEIEDNQLYQKLFAEYPSWITNPNVEEIIENNGVSESKGFLGKLFHK